MSQNYDHYPEPTDNYAYLVFAVGRDEFQSLQPLVRFVDNQSRKLGVKCLSFSATLMGQLDKRS